MKKMNTTFLVVLFLTISVLCGTAADTAQAASPDRKVAGLVDQQNYRIGVANGNETCILTPEADAFTAVVQQGSLPAGTDYWTARKSRNGKWKLQYGEKQLVCDPAQPSMLCLRADDGEKSKSATGTSSAATQKKSDGSGWQTVFENGAIRMYYETGEQLYYLTLAQNPSGAPVLTCTPDAHQASDVLLYTSGEGTGGLIDVQPAACAVYTQGDPTYQTPVYSVTATIPEGSGASYEWFLDGKPVQGGSPSFQLRSFRELGYGVHELYVRVSCTDADGFYYSERSHKVSFVSCKGVMADSFLTFSDVHECYENIGRAIDEVIHRNHGQAPSLVVCTGDWANVHPNVDMATTEHQYLPALQAQIGGLRTVYVAGNHENGAAAKEANKAADLGYDGNGVIYQDPALIVFAIDYDDLVQTDAEGNRRVSYDVVLPRLKGFFERLKGRYNHELILISSHAGLHCLGLQPESTAKDWAGEASYNVDRSDEMVRLINQYALNYDMEVMFLFGHDHSKGEKEFRLKYGDSIVSTRSYANRSYERKRLFFTYAHAGYITNTIGGSEHYSFIHWDEDALHREFGQLSETVLDDAQERGRIATEEERNDLSGSVGETLVAEDGSSRGSVVDRDVSGTTTSVAYTEQNTKGKKRVWAFTPVKGHLVRLTGIETDKRKLEIPGVITAADGQDYSVIRIGRDVLRDNQTVCQLDVPETVRRIEAGAFRGASNLRTIRILGKLRKVGSGAFRGIARDAVIILEEEPSEKVLQEIRRQAGRGVAIHISHPAM